MKFKKLISTLLLVSLLNSVTPVASLADELVCFKEVPAKKLLLDISICKQETPLLKETIDLQLTKIDGLEKDKAVYKSQSDQYKKLYIEENEARQKAESSKPSRLTWFTTGAVSAVVLGIIGIFSIRR